MIYYIYIVKESRSQQILDMCFNALLFIAMLVFCLMDGLKTPWKIKQIIVILSAFTFTYGSFYWTFTFRDGIWAKIHLWSDYSIDVDVREWAASSARIITIFIWKQAIYTIFKAPKSSVIQAPVSIVWL